jgi:hypothetical protein
MKMPISSHPLEVRHSNEQERADQRETTKNDPIPAPDVADDPVTLASWESFPASDPPAWIAGNRDGA